MATLVGRIEWCFTVSNDDLNLILKGLRGTLEKPEHIQAARTLCDELCVVKARELLQRGHAGEQLQKSLKEAGVITSKKRKPQGLPCG
jgi:hypothetical protein